MHEPDRAGISYNWTQLSVQSKVRSQDPTHICADLGSCIPHSDDLHVTRHQGFTLPLEPLKHKASIPIAWNKLRQRSEGSHYLNIVGLVVAEEFEDTVR